MVGSFARLIPEERVGTHWKNWRSSHIKLQTDFVCWHSGGISFKPTNLSSGLRRTSIYNFFVYSESPRVSPE
eukprot:8168204-Pyramimonas_sp.AAC.1